MKIIFLDFDGVLSHYNSGYNIDPEKVELLLKIVEETGAKIVISSSWRYNTVELTKKKLGDLSFFEHTIDVTPRLTYVVDGGYHSVPRGEEIKCWLKKHKNIDNYVILDDEVNDMLFYQKDHIVETDMYTGLSEKHVKQAIKILNNDNSR